MLLRRNYSGNVVAGYIPGAEPKGELKESGPSAIVDITNPQQIADAVSQYQVDTIYNLAALLSAVAENKPQLAWKIGLGGLFNTLEVAREKHCAVFTPSSIGSFGLVLLRIRLLRIQYSVLKQCMVSLRFLENC